MRWNELPGRRIGPYEIIEEIGKGGTSRVYRARTVQAEQQVAFKVIPIDAEDRAAFIQRFIREMQIVGRLRHPNIIGIYDAGETDEFVYLVMQLAMGATLRELAAERLGTREAAQYIIQAARALHHAHQQGIVHRDVKPSNMLIPRENPAHLLLTDFGTAKILGARGPTKTGATIGTPEYMSPEQAEGHEVDQRSDIYSLGCSLYEALTGRPPFVGATPVSVLYQHVHTQPTYIRTYNQAVPRELWNVVRTCLAKRPDDRYGSAERVAEELTPFAEGLIQPTPAPWRAPDTNRLTRDTSDWTPNRPRRPSHSNPLGADALSAPPNTPLPAPFTPTAAPITPGQSLPPHTPGPVPSPGMDVGAAGATGRPAMEMNNGQAPASPAWDDALGIRRPSANSGPLGRSLAPPPRAPSSQPQQFGLPPAGPYGAGGPRSVPPAPVSGFYGPGGPRSVPPVPGRAPASGPRPRATSGPLFAPGGPGRGPVSGIGGGPISGAEWPAADAQPAGYRGPVSGSYRGPNSQPHRGAASGPTRAPNSGYGARASGSGAARLAAGRRAAPVTRRLKSRPAASTVVAGFVALLLLGGATALGAAGMGWFPVGGSVKASPTITARPTATPRPTATATPAAPTATATPTSQQVLNRQAAASFKGISLTSFTDFSCSSGSQVSNFTSSQAVFINLCTARGSMPGPVTVQALSGGTVVRTFFNHQYLASNSGYSQGHTLGPGTYHMVVTVTINGANAVAEDIPFTVR